MTTKHARRRTAIAGLGLLLIMSGHASAQNPIYVPTTPQWSASGVTSSMSLTPIWTKLGIGLSSPQTALHVIGGNVISSPGTGSVTIGPTNAVHMQMDRNDIRVAGPSAETFGSLYFQRYGGPIVVHASQDLGDRVYITSKGDVGVGTADPQQFAIDRELVPEGWWTVHDGLYEKPILAVDGNVFARSVKTGGLSAKGAVIGPAINPNGVKFAQDTLHKDAVLIVGGKITAQSIVVHLKGWADDVFDDDYPLLPLSELADFVKRERHLPDVPTEAEVLSSGLDIADSNEVLLRKVEELTLYTIAQQEQIDALERKIDALAQ